jgi:hypothetical protein
MSPFFAPGRCLGRLALPTLVAAAGLVTGGCRGVLGIEDTVLAEDEEEVCEGGDVRDPTARGLGWWSSCVEGSACFSASRPTASDRPDAATEGESIAGFFLGLDRLLLGSRGVDGRLDPTAWQRVGFDLDDLCTGSTTCSADSPELACEPNSGAVPQDGEHCLDNQLGQLDYQLDTLPETSGKYSATDRDLNCYLCRGAFNLLTRITEYNGQPDDPRVRVDLYPSPGTAALGDADCGELVWPEADCWDRSEPWLIDGEYLESDPGESDLAPSTLDDPGAYVSGGWLVITLPENTPLGLVSIHPEAPPVLRLVIRDGLLVGRLHHDGGQWRVDDGLISGRARLTDLEREFGNLGLCAATDPVATALVTRFMETAADLVSTGPNVPDAPCDALSLALAVSARQATPGELASAAAPHSPECSGGG